MSVPCINDCHTAIVIGSFPFNRIVLPCGIRYVGFAVEKCDPSWFVEGTSEDIRHIAISNVNNMHLMRRCTGNVQLLFVDKSDLLGGRAGLNRDFTNNLSVFQVDNQDVVAGACGTSNG